MLGQPLRSSRQHRPLHRGGLLKAPALGTRDPSASDQHSGLQQEHCNHDTVQKLSAESLLDAYFEPSRRILDEALRLRGLGACIDLLIHRNLSVTFRKSFHIHLI